jgi:endonuclease/exonuclease/phosphatase family metal-dependent hydrolase
VTWIKFRDRQTRQEFYYWNTHFDHEIQPAREKSAVLVRQRIEALKTDLPVILGGDFNAGAGQNKAYDELVRDDFFKDTWAVAKARVGEGLGTFNGFKAVPKDGVRIDWILVRGNIAVDKAEIVTLTPKGQFASDHFPVAAWIRLGP